MRGKGAYIRELLARRVGDISLNELRFLKGELTGVSYPPEARLEDVLRETPEQRS